MGNEDDNPTKNCWIHFLSPICLLVSLNAEVLVVVVVVGCVQGSWSQVSTFSCYSHCLPLTQNASKGVWKQFSRTCAIIQIKYVMPILCHLPQYSYGSRDPTTRVGFRDPGSVLILGQVTQYGNPYLICITREIHSFVRIALLPSLNTLKIILYVHEHTKHLTISCCIFLSCVGRTSSSHDIDNRWFRIFDNALHPITHV